MASRIRAGVASSVQDKCVVHPPMKPCNKSPRTNGASPTPDPIDVTRMSGAAAAGGSGLRAPAVFERQDSRGAF